MKKLLLPILLCFACASISQTINVNDPADPENALNAEDLINQVLIGGYLCTSRAYLPSGKL